MTEIPVGSRVALIRLPISDWLPPTTQWQLELGMLGTVVGRHSHGVLYAVRFDEPGQNYWMTSENLEVVSE